MPTATTVTGGSPKPVGGHPPTTKLKPVILSTEIKVKLTSVTLDLRHIP